MRVIPVSTGTATLLANGSVTFSGALPDFVSTIPVFKPPRNPDLGPNRAVEHLIHEVSFGDGYSQRGEQGLNSVRGQLQLSWRQLHPEQKDAIDNFLVARRGVEPFFYGIPGDKIFMWTCPGHSVSPHQPFLWQAMASFKRCFDPVP